MISWDAVGVAAWHAVAGVAAQQSPTTVCDVLWTRSRPYVGILIGQHAGVATEGPTMRAHICNTF